MSKRSWKNPPPLVAIGGDEHFLRGREIRKAVLQTVQDGRTVIWAEKDSEVVDALTMAATFGEASLIIIPGGVLEIETAREFKANPTPKTCILLTFDGPFDPEKTPILTEVHGASQVQFIIPKTKKDHKAFVVRFVKAEASEQLGVKEGLSTKLAEAIIGVVGNDLGTLYHELLKITALARSRGAPEIQIEHVKSLIRASTEVNLDGLRDALRRRDGAGVAKEMDRIYRLAPTEPTMLLLRGRGGPADLALKWLRTAVLLENGAQPSEIASRISSPEWIVTNDLIPGAQRWGSTRLRELVANLAHADRSVKFGAPSPWLALESALLIGCSG